MSKTLISVFFFFIFNQFSYALERNCSCVGLASNFPGVSLICDNKIISRTFFYDDDQGLALRVCSNDQIRAQGGTIHSAGLGMCLTKEDEIVLLLFIKDHSFNVLHSYRFNDLPGSKDLASGTCQNQLAELIRSGVCENPQLR